MSDEGYNLGKWVAVQRYYCNKGYLDKGRIDKLNKLGIIWDINSFLWGLGYEHLLEYQQNHPNWAGKVPKDFVCSDGFKLGSWAHVQRYKHKSDELCGVRYAQLENIGFSFNNSNKKTYSEIVASFADKGLILVSEEYKGIKESLQYVCKTCGFRGETTAGSIVRGSGCLRCKRGYNDLNSAKKVFKSKKLTLLDNEFINSTNNMKYVCNICGYEGTKSLKIAKRSGCPRCAGLVKKDISYVRDVFDSLNLNLLVTTYANKDPLLRYKCKVCGYKGSKTLGNASRGHGCPQCAGNSKKTINADILKRILKFCDNMPVSLGTLLAKYNKASGEKVSQRTMQRYLKKCPQIKHVPWKGYMWEE